MRLWQRMYADGVSWLWTREEATVALRLLIARQGLQAEEYALHSGRIGGATRLAAARVSAFAIQREGRRKSDAFMEYVRANAEGVREVSSALAVNAEEDGVQPGQRFKTTTTTGESVVWPINK